MVVGYEEIEFGDQKLELVNLSRVKVPGTVKQKVGGKLVKHNIPGLTVRDWKITANGVIFDKAGTVASTGRRLLEEAFDLEKRHYSDGLILASMVIDNLTFNDSDQSPLIYSYNITLIQHNQED